MPENAKVDSLAAASPLIAVVAALFLSGCAILAVSSGTELLLSAGSLAFMLGQAAALILGVAGAVRAFIRKTAGLPEALLGLFAVCLFCLTALFLIFPCMTPPAP